MNPPEYTTKFFGTKIKLPPHAEIPKDRFGRLAHTYVTIFIPYKIMDDPNASIFECPVCGTEISSTVTTCSICGAKFEQTEAEKPAHSNIKKTAIALLNKFLEVYRLYAHEYHIEPIKNTDIISFECNYIRRGKLYTGYRYLVDTGSGGIKSGNVFILDDHIHKKIRDFLKSGQQIEIHTRLLCNSKNHLAVEEYHLALIEAVSALDIILSAFIRKEGSIRVISKKAIENFIHDVGVSGRVKVVLKLLTTGEDQLSNAVYSDCEGAITLRNKVIHQGLLKLNPTDIKRRIFSVETMINYVQALLHKHTLTA